jgi:hypothetical protein
MLITEAEPVHHSRTKLLDDYVGIGCKREYSFKVVALLQIGGEAPFPAVQQGELICYVVEFGAVQAHVVTAAGPLNLEYVGTGFTQHQRRHGSWQESGKIQHANAS